jgi:Ca-activated chloride channel family protein
LKNLLTLSLILLLLTCAARISSAQSRPRRAAAEASTQASPTPVPTPLEEIGEGEVLRVNTTLVTVPVSVTDRDGRYIADLRKEDFRLFENGVEQQVTYFEAVEKPFTVVLVLDTSSSTWSKLGQIRDAALAFVNQLRPEDSVMVVSFARGLTIKCEATKDRKAVRDAIKDTGRGMSTHLYDALHKLMQKYLNRIDGRKAVVLFTDGVDATSSDATYESTVREAEELDAIIYPILYDTYDPAFDRGTSAPTTGGSRLPSILGRLPIPFPTQGGTNTGGGGAGSSRADYDRGARYLRDLAVLTGGRVYEARRDLSYLEAAFNHIAEELRRQYSLGYYPRQGAQTGERRRIKVRVTDQPNLAVRARDSYIYKPAPQSPDNTADTKKESEPKQDAPVLKKKQFSAERLRR